MVQTNSLVFLSKYMMKYIGCSCKLYIELQQKVNNKFTNYL